MDYFIARIIRAGHLFVEILSLAKQAVNGGTDNLILIVAGRPFISLRKNFGKRTLMTIVLSEALIFNSDL